MLPGDSSNGMNTGAPNVPRIGNTPAVPKSSRSMYRPAG
jgi:hypothetical protein